MTARRNAKRAAARIEEGVKGVGTFARERRTKITTALCGKHSCH